MIIISDDFKDKDIFERGNLTMRAELDTLNKFLIPLDILKMTNSEYKKGLENKRYVAQLI